ncbi:glutathione S-transferase family protein [Myxococcota bacterium]|nr:glutathione S-transferase family protein [Myxococcota bacterium]
MRFYTFQVAPNPTRVGLYLAEKTAAGAAMNVENVIVNLAKREHRSSEHIARNPLGRLPVLELDNGSFLTESTVIVEYLEELHPDPPMIGTTAEERARVRELERIAELGVLVPIARIVHATKSPLGLPPNPEIAALFDKLLPEGLGLLNDKLSDGRAFLAGDCPTIADCTLQAGLQFGRYGKIKFDLPEQLARWDLNYRERDPALSVLVL